MPDEMTINEAVSRNISIRHQGRGPQVMIYLGKFFRMFIYQNDWKVLPMAAVIAGLVGMVIRSMLFVTMEGTLMGAFALSCVAIWNGCFNSIQVICRERDVIKREHRAGMHISSYVTAHLIYQAFLCLLQAAITIYIMNVVGVKIPKEGLFTPWMMVDLGITLFLIAFASDALSLWVSALSRNTTTAMTIMPFVLIFQLVFSGAMLSLPSWCRPLTGLTVSNYGLTAIASQADYNSRPLVTAWSSVVGMRNVELGGETTVGEVLEFLQRDDIPAVHALRETKLEQKVTLREILELLEFPEAEETAELLLDSYFGPELRDREIDVAFTLGEVVDAAAESPALEQERARTLSYTTTVDDIIQMIGEDRAHWEIQERATEAAFDEHYVNTKRNIASCWFSLALITLVCAALTTVTLEFIDKDKR